MRSDAPQSLRFSRETIPWTKWFPWEPSEAFQKALGVEESLTEKEKIYGPIRQ